MNHRLEPETEASARGFGLCEEDGRRLLRAISDSLLIRCHYQLFVWLMGELQLLLPHDILVSAWGDFDRAALKLDVISSLPSVRTGQIARCKLEDVVGACRVLWLEADRQPRIGQRDEIKGLGRCPCAVHGAIRAMRYVVIHGVTDARSGDESLYIAFATGSPLMGRPRERFVAVVNALVPQIDLAFRRVKAYPFDSEGAATFDSAVLVELSPREREILDQVCRGKTNVHIAKTLGISPYTVKNHVQRIFRKIGVTNRTEAAAKYYSATGRTDVRDGG